MKKSLIIILAAASLAVAVSVTYSPTDIIDLRPIQDTWIMTGYGPFGSSSTMNVNQDSTYDQRPVLQWDLSSIEGCTINSAIFYVYRYDGNGSLSADVYRVTESWDEETLVAPLAHDGSTVWATGDAGDPSGWKTFDVTDLVQGWVDCDFDNYGLLCKGYGSGWYQAWLSKDCYHHKPYLDIDYIIPETNPPYVDGLEPEDGATGVPLDSDIVFHCKDDTQIMVDTIVFTARDTTLNPRRALGSGSSNRTLDGELEIDDADLTDVVCTFNPIDDFLEGETITCTVDGCLADVCGNEMGDDFVWSFDTEVAVEETTWGAIKAQQ